MEEIPWSCAQLPLAHWFTGVSNLRGSRDGHVCRRRAWRPGPASSPLDEAPRGSWWLSSAPVLAQSARPIAGGGIGEERSD
jgi:hypothetical protein